MKICYVWVERFRNFEKFGFNLSSSRKFEYESEENKLHVKEITPLPSDFFGEEIIDVIGLIGKNGSGKSNAVELVCKVVKGAKTSLQNDFFIIVEEHNSLVCYYSFAQRNKPEAHFNISFKEYNGTLDPLKVIFFSNVFDGRKNEFDKEVSDISVNNRLDRHFLSRRDKTTDFEKQIRLINSKIFPKLEIDLPTEVQITSKLWTGHINASMERRLYGSAYENIKDLKTLFRHRLRDIKYDKKLIHFLRFGFFFETLNYFLKERGRGSQYEETIMKSLVNLLPPLINSRTEEISDKLIGFWEEQLLNDEFSQFIFSVERDNKKRKSRLDKFEKQIKFLRHLPSLLPPIIEYNKEGLRNRGLEYFYFDYYFTESKRFIDDFTKLFGHSSFFEINWIGISSGHKAYLNLFASIYLELLNTQKQPNLLICIDEGDLYLHPMWQTEFFDRLINVLPLISLSKIQLILTSHSPFLLSDLPKQNITILNRGTSQDGVTLTINTFGGNLYDLYAEPFFLKDKKTSDFAYKKISFLIETIEKGRLTKSEKSELIKMVDLIGDEIIQFELKKLLQND